MYFRQIASWVIALQASIVASGVAQASEDITVFTGRTMGTTFHVRCVLPPGVRDEQVSERIAERLEKVNQQMSTYIADSELSRFNRSTEVDTWFAVSPETAKVVAYALQVAADSGGAFDPTIGPLVDLWGFGPDKRRPEPPTDEEIAAAQESVGFENVAFRVDPPALKKFVAGVELNLSAVAKGYGVDAVGEELEHFGCRSFMVEIGGEVLAKGRKPEGGAWKIGIESADSNARAISEIVALEGEAIATSGDYRNFFEFDGKRYSHTIDPTTGRPVEHTLATVTVRAPTCMEADALATAILVLGPRAGYDWAVDHRIAARLVERQNDQLRETSTTAWGESQSTATPAPLPENESSDFMAIYIVTAVVFALAMAAMAVGVMFSGRRIRGSCGGLAGLRDEVGNPACELCSHPSPSCTGNPDERTEAEHAEDVRRY